MKQVLGPGALGRPRGIGWRGRWEGGWGIHVTPWLIHVNVWQNPLKCCEVISLQLIKINGKKIKIKKLKKKKQKKLKVELPWSYNPTTGQIAWEQHGPKMKMFQKDTCTPVLTEVLFITGNSWKQPEYLVTEELVKKMWNSGPLPMKYSKLLTYKSSSWNISKMRTCVHKSNHVLVHVSGAHHHMCTLYKWLWFCVLYCTVSLFQAQDV